MRLLTLYISMSLDGYVATNDDRLDFLDSVDHGGEDYGYNAFVETIDTYIVGRKTYDVVRNLLGGTFPQAEKYDCYIISRTESGQRDGVTFYNGSPQELIAKIRSKEGKGIFCDGGPEIVKWLREMDLIDRYVISIAPYLLGEGKKLFLPTKNEGKLKLIEAKSFPSGFVQVMYEKQSNSDF